MDEMKKFFSLSNLLLCFFLIVVGSLSAYAQYRFDHY